MRLRLYHYWRSSCSWRVRWGMALKNIPCEFVAINILTDEPESPEHKLRNPLGFVPTLEWIQGPEVAVRSTETHPSLHYLSESLAILEWMEETHPAPSLLPGDAPQRARIRQLAEIINAGTQPIQNTNVTHFYSSDPVEQKKWMAHWIRRGLQAYEDLVKETAQTFSVGNTLTLADLCLIPQCYNALRQAVELQDFPTIERIYQAALATPSCQSAAPDQFKPREA